MLPLFEMLNNAGQGNGVDQIARQFGISNQQAQEAMEALLPAFSQGLKRNAADPYGAGNFLGALASGQHAKYFEDAANAFSPVLPICTNAPTKCSVSAANMHQCAGKMQV